MKKIFLLIPMLFMASLLMAQTTVTMDGTLDRTGCDFKIFDHGGLNGNYAANRNDILTLHSNNTAAGCVQISIDMQDFDIDPSDTLYIYDGTSDTDPLLGKLNNDLVANVSANNIIYTATVSNSTGAITIKFVSDADDQNNAGYVITTECVAPCQRVQVSLDSAASSHFPQQDEDGFFYIDLCPYDTAHLVVYGTYPDNNFSYTQSDQTSTFTWDMSLETLDGVGMTSLDYYFTPGRGYDVSITIEDVEGCKTTMPYIFRVRTSKNPIRSLAPLPEVCAGQTLNLSVGYDNISSLQVDTVGSEQITSMAVTDTIFLPDGIDCGNGCYYQSPVTFTSFAPSATIQSADDILFVRAKMEHSFVGDIFIGLTCPSGQMAKIMNKYGSSGSAACSGFIPQPWGWAVTSGVSSGADFGIVASDNSSNKCSTQLNPMGTTWNYCWSNNTTQGYVYAGGQGHVYESVNVHGSSIDSTNVAAMTQVYHPDQSFGDLIGCPMNGTWALTVIDAWSADNGYITEWEMALDPSLLPQDWSYRVLVDSMWIDGPGATGDFIVPDTAGLLNYTIYVRDEFGCIYDTTTTLQVTPGPKPDLGEDFNICHGDVIKLSADFDEPNTVYRWNTGDDTEDIDVLSEGTYALTVTTTNDAGTLVCHGSDTINIGIYESPMIDYDLSDSVGCSPLILRTTNRSTPTTATYEWYILYPDGSVAYSSALPEPSFNIDEPGTYSVVLKMTTQDGCKDSLYKWNAFTVNLQPIAEFAADPEISLMSEYGGVVHFINYADSISMTDPNSSFFWDFGDEETDSETFSPQHIYSSWGDYDVTLHIETNAGCSSEITHTVVIEQDLVFPNVITPNGDNMNDVFAIENLNTNVNLEDPDQYRNNKLYIYDRWGKKVYEAHNYDTFAKDGTIYKGTQYFDGGTLPDGVYYYSFYYKGKAKTVNYNGSLSIIR